jgi:hypothetical protein
MDRDFDIFQCRRQLGLVYCIQRDLDLDDLNLLTGQLR